MQSTKFAALFGTLAVCAEAPAVEVMGNVWKGAGEFGYMATSGNTETQSLAAKLGLTHDRIKWRHTLALEALNNSDADETTAERYSATWQTDYKLSPRSYLFGRLHYETDKFSGYDYRTSETLGYGRRVVKTETMTLDLEAGAGARQSRLENDGTDDEPILRLAGKYAWQISPHAAFTEELSSDIGRDATITRSVTALKADIVGNLALKLSVTVEHTSDVPPDIDNTDTETGVSLVYSF